MNEFADTLRSKLRARMNELADEMLAGGCSDYAAYRMFVGKIEGLAEAERYLLDLDKQLQDILDDEDA